MKALLTSAVIVGITRFDDGRCAVKMANCGQRNGTTYEVRFGAGVVADDGESVRLGATDVRVGYRASDVELESAHEPEAWERNGKSGTQVKACRLVAKAPGWDSGEDDASRWA